MARKPHKCEAFQGKFLIGQKTITADSYVRDHQKFQKIYGSIADKILALKKEGDFLEIGAGGATLLKKLTMSLLLQQIFLRIW